MARRMIPRLKAGAVMRHLRWAMPEALLISVRMNIPCWIMATIAGVSQRIGAQMPPSTTDVLNMAAAQPLVFDAELDTVRERLGSVKGGDVEFGN